jgi:uncharacterized membrane protein YfcA
MGFSLAQYALVVVVMTFGAVVQGAVGFASGLIGVPLLVLGGLSIQEAATINLVSTSVQNVAGSWRLRSELAWRDVAAPVLVRSCTIPLGTWALWHADGLEPRHARQLIGWALLVMVAAIAWFRVAPRERLGWGWQLAAFVSSGFLLGFAAIGGAPMVMYVNSLTWSARKSRAFLFFCSATGAPLMAAALWWQFGERVWPAALAAAAAMPAILAGLACGMTLGARLDKHLFRRLTFGLLAAIAIGAIVSG